MHGDGQLTRTGGSGWFGKRGRGFAYALLLSGLAAEIVLIDSNHSKAEGEAMDLSHTVPFTHPTGIALMGAPQGSPIVTPLTVNDYCLVDPRPAVIAACICCVSIDGSPIAEK